MLEKSNFITILYAIRDNVTHENIGFITSVCRFINSFFCNCRYTEYWVLDLNFGKNHSKTEMGFELDGIDTIEKFIDFLYEKKWKNQGKTISQDMAN